MKAYSLAIVFAVAGLTTIPFAHRALADDGQAAAAENAWARLPELLQQIKTPAFPDRKFDIIKFGAVGDGATDCSKAIADAIAACNQAGGGRVVVPAGKFLTGPIHLLSNVNLHLEKDATILFSTDFSKYLPVVYSHFESVEAMNYSPFVYAFRQENIAITGEGTLDGQAIAAGWHKWKSLYHPDEEALADMAKNDLPVEERVFGAGHFLRPNFIQPTCCRNVLIEGVTVINSPMWVLNPRRCTNVVVHAVTVRCTGPNTDGCDPDACHNVWIKDCSFSDGDDCIAIKSGRDHDGHRVNLPSDNIVIQDCKFQAGHGGVTCGSETAGGIHNVFAENCEFNSPDLEMALRFKTNPARGGSIDNVFIRNCAIKTAKYGIHMTLRYSSAGALEGEYIPEIKNIDIRDCTFANLTRQPVFIEGYSAAIKISGVTIANCSFAQVGKPGATITNAVDIHLLGNHGGGLD
jgi:polygalacturonase